MIKVFRDSGFPVRTHTLPGVLLVEFPTSLPAEAWSGLVVDLARTVPGVVEVRSGPEQRTP